MGAVPAIINSNIEMVLMQGDLARLSVDERISYINRLCEVLGLNPLTRPFDYIQFQGKLVLYATKNCAEQLRKIHGVSITSMKTEILDGMCIVTVEARDRSGKEDRSTGVLDLGRLSGVDKANAMMKTETKAKRRVTLSICGLGLLDESEIEDMRNVREPAKGVLTDGNEEFKTRVAELMTKFRAIGVSESMICQRYNIAKTEQLSAEQYDELRTIGPVIRDDRAKMSEFFQSHVGSKS